jgi:phosphoribosylformylglycinamidine synthase
MDFKVCVIRAPGTNCDIETAWSINKVGIKAEVVHIKKFMEDKTFFSSYGGLIIPGGFSFGDHVRAGALLGKMLKERFRNVLLDFSNEGKPILGICNGFQVLVECGLLPGGKIEGALTTNLSSRFECRWVNLKIESDHCVFTKGMEGLITLPVAHGEGRFLVDNPSFEHLKEKRQIVMRYALDDGKPALGRYPDNPNGSIDDIAGVCNERGNVLGLMPHPERAFNRFTHPNWTRDKGIKEGDGFKIFKNMAEHVKS